MNEGLHTFFCLTPSQELDEQNYNMFTINADLFEESLNELRQLQQNRLLQEQERDITIPQETALCLLCMIDFLAKSRFDSLDMALQKKMLQDASKILKHNALNANSRLTEKNIQVILSLLATDF